jgi:hypothetical protein
MPDGSHLLSLLAQSPQWHHPQAKELETISRILDWGTTIVEMVYQDLCRNHPLSITGARGMIAGQVLRAAIVKQPTF